MNWDALGAIGELVGAAAVVLTLGYLAVQIQQSTKLARATAQRDLNMAFQSTINKIGEQPVIFQRGCTDFQSMSRKDQLTFDIIIASLIVHLDEAIRMHQHGLETDDYIESYGAVCLAIIQAPGTRYWYEKVKPFFMSAAVEYLEKRFADPASLPPAMVDVLPWHCPALTQSKT